MAFETAWSNGGSGAIHAYTDPPSIRSVAIADDATEIDQIKDATQYDPSSRIRTPHVGEILVWQNTAGYFLATKVLSIQVRNPGVTVDQVTMEYKIAQTKSASFSGEV